MSSLASQSDHFAFADVCGNGITGNAGFYANLTIPTQFDNPPSHLSPVHPPNQLISPKRLQFGTYETRLASYATPNWPTNCPVSQELLSAAGLFYHGHFQGHKDSVQCYYCGIGLCLWQPGDDPWSEHKRVSPNCSFLQDNINKEKYETLKKDSLQELAENFTSIEISKPAEPNGRKTLCHRLTCKVCLEQELSVLFLPCAHLVACQRCASNVTKCPLCRHPIHRTIATFIG